MTASLTSLEKMHPHLPVMYTSKRSDFNTIKYEKYLEYVTDSLGKETVEERYGPVIKLDPLWDIEHKSSTPGNGFAFEMIAIQLLGMITTIALTILVYNYLPKFQLPIK